VRSLLLALLVTLAFGSACRPDFGERESFVDRPQVLAVRIEPPEGKPGEPVSATLLVASPSGPVDAPPASWAFCATPKLLTENGSVSAACLAAGVVPIGDAPGGVTAALPQASCFDFGPETQSAEVRPRDADVTGGYFLPIRARVRAAVSAEPLTAFGFARLTCNLPNAPAAAVADRAGAVPQPLQVSLARAADEPHDRRSRHPALCPSPHICGSGTSYAPVPYRSTNGGG